MKKLLLTLSVAFLMLGVSAQNEKYISAMQSRLTALDSTRDVSGLKDLSAAFERIAEAEKTQWLPYYYAALTQVNAGFNLFAEAAQKGEGGDMASKVDPMADKAEQLLNKAEALSKDNSEIYIIKKMIGTLRFMVDPMTRYMQYGPKAAEDLAKAKKLNPENPRVYYMEGMDKFNTPEQFGGSKTEAKKLFEQALEKYETFKPASPIDPNWGKNATQYFISQCK